MKLEHFRPVKSGNVWENKGLSDALYSTAFVALVLNSPFKGGNVWKKLSIFSAALNVIADLCW